VDGYDTMMRVSNEDMRGERQRQEKGAKRGTRVPKIQSIIHGRMMAIRDYHSNSLKGDQ
jgi:hypothetical protein